MTTMIDVTTVSSSESVVTSTMALTTGKHPFPCRTPRPAA